jgi:hypothetical protein
MKNVSLRDCCAGGIDGTKQNGLRMSALVLGDVQVDCASSTRPVISIVNAACGSANAYQQNQQSAFAHLTNDHKQLPE